MSSKYDVEEAGSQARAKLILPHKDPKLYKRVIREKDKALVMASQIEDDYVPTTYKPKEIKHADWVQEASSAGRKLDLIPSYDEIMSETTQSSFYSQRRRQTASPSLISQSQPARTRKIRAPFANTQKSHEIIDLEDIDNGIDFTHLLPATAPSPPSKPR